ncbi:BrnA antitoxin family protein [uncultured Pseudacidovorax sp.]|uniref:BrnA antitoxin family protein n=1 Tax=uncultured Pseudacidovorax sp. TaxID=679313 RepID=UPI0025CEE603|nr:BrnA antitoxin family protein [uncultured Pseudacidovorax sp.]
MQKYLTTKGGKKILLNTPVEDAAVDAGIKADPDTLEVTEGMAAQMRPFRRAGRPPLESPKEPVTMRVDADVLAAIKATGRGWQTRVNSLLREAVQQGRFGGLQR